MRAKWDEFLEASKVEKMYGRAWGKGEEISQKKCLGISVVSRKTSVLDPRKNRPLN